MRRLLLPQASMYVFGVDLSDLAARVADHLLVEFVSLEDASRRPTLQRAETRQFLVAARPFLAALVKYSPAEIVAMRAR